MFGLQEGELFCKKIQKNGREKIGNAKILQILQKTHVAQRREKVMLKQKVAFLE